MSTVGVAAQRIQGSGVFVPQCLPPGNRKGSKVAKLSSAPEDAVAKLIMAKIPLMAPTVIQHLMDVNPSLDTLVRNMPVVSPEVLKVLQSVVWNLDMDALWAEFQTAAGSSMDVPGRSTGGSSKSIKDTVPASNKV